MQPWWASGTFKRKKYLTNLNLLNGSVHAHGYIHTHIFIDPTCFKRYFLRYFLTILPVFVYRNTHNCIHSNPAVSLSLLAENLKAALSSHSASTVAVPSCPEEQTQPEPCSPSFPLPPENQSPLMDTLQRDEEEWRGEEGLETQAFNHISDADHDIHLKVNVFS